MPLALSEPMMPLYWVGTRPTSALALMFSVISASSNVEPNAITQDYTRNQNFYLIKKSNGSSF